MALDNAEVMFVELVGLKDALKRPKLSKALSKLEVRDSGNGGRSSQETVNDPKMTKEMG